MTDSRTGIIKMVSVIGAGYNDLVEEPELIDLVLDCQERFEASVKDRPTKLPPMARNDQHDMGKTLKEIQATKAHTIDVGHGRYW